MSQIYNYFTKFFFDNKKKDLPCYSTNIGQIYYKTDIDLSLKIDENKILKKDQSGLFSKHFEVIDKNTKKKYIAREVNLTAGNAENREVLSRTIGIERAHNIHISINHPNILKYHKVAQKEKDIVYEIYDYYDKNLLNYFKEKQFKLYQKDYKEINIFRIILQLCLAIDYLHNQKILLGPNLLENIVVVEIENLPNIKITYFVNSVNLTESQMKNHDFPSDMLEVGKILYQLFNNLELPFKNKEKYLQRKEKCKDLPEGLSNNAYNFLEKLLEVEDKNRMTISEVFNHKWVLENILKLDFYSVLNPLFVGNKDRLQQIFYNLINENKIVFNEKEKIEQFSCFFHYELIPKKPFPILKIFNEIEKEDFWENFHEKFYFDNFKKLAENIDKSNCFSFINNENVFNKKFKIWDDDSELNQLLELEYPNIEESILENESDELKKKLEFDEENESNEAKKKIEFHEENENSYDNNIFKNL